MYRLSSYVLGSMIAALMMTPFVSGPDRSFVGSLLATTATEPVVSVNRALKGDRQTASSAVAEQATRAQSIQAKNAAPKASPKITPAANHRLLDGCESAFSEITDRQLANIAGRCVASLERPPLQMASAN